MPAIDKAGDRRKDGYDDESSPSSLTRDSRGCSGGADYLSLQDFGATSSDDSSYSSGSSRRHGYKLRAELRRATREVRLLKAEIAVMQTARDVGRYSDDVGSPFRPLPSKRRKLSASLKARVPEPSAAITQATPLRPLPRLRNVWASLVSQTKTVSRLPLRAAFSLIGGALSLAANCLHSRTVRYFISRTRCSQQVVQSYATGPLFWGAAIVSAVGTAAYIYSITSSVGPLDPEVYEQEI